MHKKKINDILQLEKWKTDLLKNFIIKIAQIYKVHEKKIKAKQKEIEKQPKQF